MATSPQTATTSDSITKQVTVRATPARVWRALSNAQEFATWFGIDRMQDAFVPGKPATGVVRFQGREHSFTIHIERLEPERLLAFRWHPFAVELDRDYSQEPMTLVEISLEPAGAGTRITVVESGFDRIPAERRAKAFEMNTGGWAEQMQRIARHVDA
jgi:uncharacterized protein YndB with AHSA1/START domain